MQQCDTCEACWKLPREGKLTAGDCLAGPGAHFCENVGRAHRSNYVYFVVNLRNAQYAQKCHDPDCAHFRSEWMPLPRALVLQSQAS